MNDILRYLLLETMIRYLEMNHHAFNILFADEYLYHKASFFLWRFSSSSSTHTSRIRPLLLNRLDARTWIFAGGTRGAQGVVAMGPKVGNSAGDVFFVSIMAADIFGAITSWTPSCVYLVFWRFLKFPKKNKSDQFWGNPRDFSKSPSIFLGVKGNGNGLFPSRWWWHNQIHPMMISRAGLSSKGLSSLTVAASNQSAPGIPKKPVGYSKVGHIFFWGPAACS